MAGLRVAVRAATANRVRAALPLRGQRNDRFAPVAVSGRAVVPFPSLFTLESDGDVTEGDGEPGRLFDM